MKTIIAEKPSVAREIARIVGATKREDGYLSGNNYYVTWALGHLITPALPDGYGIKGFHRDNLPIIPPVFKLVPRQKKTGTGYHPDKNIVKQIKIISGLFKQSESIIVATDAGREGELIFRYLYEYLGCKIPFERLWINSLTPKTIRQGLDNLKSGNQYDHLYCAAKARSEADWLVGINATQAISIAAGRGTYSLGRVQTPTLAMVCARYWENKRFVHEKFWKLHLSTAGKGKDDVLQFSSVNKWTDQQEAEKLYNTLKDSSELTITKMESKDIIEESPLLYDLTALQKDANTQYGFSADKTLSIAQKLYEAKLITYPRTGSRYIPEDVFVGIPSILQSLKNSVKWGRQINRMDELSRHSVNTEAVSDHHALLITGIKAKNLSSDEATIYHMIIGRMLESFSPKCIKEITTISAECANIEFVLKNTSIIEKGWRSIYDKIASETELPEIKKGDILPIIACSKTGGRTSSKPLHTEASLLSAMENAGKEMKEDKMDSSCINTGIGTPATRASIIETLLKRNYIVRRKKSLVPTEKGLALYSIVKDMPIANVKMTGEWEQALSKIESGQMQPDIFRKNIDDFTAQITTELLSCDKLFSHKESQYLCPKCKTGHMQFYSKVVRCDNPKCGLPIFRQKSEKALTNEEIESLLKNSKTDIISGFISQKGKPFSAAITFDNEFNTTFIFPDLKAQENKTE